MYDSSGHALSLDRKKIIRTTLKHFTPNRKFRMLWLDGNNPCSVLCSRY